ncbi:MAG: TonB-dependent receptor [Gammaproteobacteria bacterium]|nr:TonB-dependent receptor [Gammaproteobacteria bacterium]
MPAVYAAEEEGATSEKVVITGSRIRRTDVEGANPVVVLDRQAIEATGKASVGDILQDLPAAGSAINTVFNNGGDGSTEVDLRNLGANRVLVLVNGRRWVPGIGGTVDLNNIPSAIIERIEVLKDGASAIYGSDAIAGVVNIFTRKDYEGAYLNAYYGENEEGDGTIENYDFGFGVAGDKGSLFMAGSYLQQSEILAGNRAISAVPVFGTTPDNFGGSSGTPQGRFLGLTPGGGFFDQTLTPDGNFTPWGPNSPFNFAPDNYLQTPSKRSNLFVTGNYEISDSVMFTTEAFYSNRRSSQLLAPTPLFIGYYSSGLGQESYLAADNPYNPFGFDLTSSYTDWLDSFNNGGSLGWLGFFGRRMVEAGGRDFAQDVDQFQWSAGLNGSFEAANRFFDWDVNYITSYVQQNDLTEGLLNMQRLNQALLGPSSGCGDGCVPFNFFGGQGVDGQGTITQEQLDYVLFTAQDTAESTMDSFSANISGEIIDLPAGALGFAAGVESRKLSGFDQPDALIAAGITSGNARQPTKGSYSLDESFVEFAAPILRDMPGVEMLELSLAFRNSDYSNFGSTTTSKVGLKYKPIDDLLIRATWAEGFRAPTVSELFLGNSDSFPTVSDPCSAIGSLDADSSGVIELDEATSAGIPGCAGVNATYVQPNPQIRITVGGNEDLQPEESDSHTFGFVYAPSQVEGLEITADMWQITVEENIGTLGAQFILNSCATAGNFCNLIDRTSVGNVQDLFNGLLNTGKLEVEGTDLTVTYKMPETDFGSFRFIWDTTHSKEYGTFDEQTDGSISYNDFVGVAGDRIVLPEIRSNLNIFWSMDDFEATWQMRYISSTTEGCDLGNGGAPGAGFENTNNGNEVALCSDLDPLTGTDVTGDGNVTVADYNAYNHENEVKSSVWHDVSFSYYLADINGKLTVGGINVFGKDPAVSYSTFANSFDPTMYDVPGAFWYFRYNQQF